MAGMWAWSLYAKKIEYLQNNNNEGVIVMIPSRVNSYKQHYWYLQSLKADKKQQSTQR